MWRVSRPSYSSKMGLCRADSALLAGSAGHNLDFRPSPLCERAWNIALGDIPSPTRSHSHLHTPHIPDLRPSHSRAPREHLTRANPTRAPEHIKSDYAAASSVPGYPAHVPVQTQPAHLEPATSPPCSTTTFDLPVRTRTDHLAPGLSHCTPQPAHLSPCKSHTAHLHTQPD